MVTKEEWRKMTAQMGYPSAADIAISTGTGITTNRILAELLIAFAAGRIEGSSWGEMLDVEPISDFQDEALEEIPLGDYGDDWLLANKPEGTVVPPASGRETVRTPNLKSANPSFAALLIRHVQEKFGGDAPQVYRAAHVSRKTYSSIVSNELRTVSKQTAISFALALRLSIEEANALLNAAGHALSDFLLDDMIFKACIVTGIHDIDTVNQILTAHATKPLPFCQG